MLNVSTVGKSGANVEFETLNSNGVIDAVNRNPNLHGILSKWHHCHLLRRSRKISSMTSYILIFYDHFIHVWLTVNETCVVSQVTNPADFPELGHVDGVYSLCEMSTPA